MPRPTSGAFIRRGRWPGGSDRLASDPGLDRLLSAPRLHRPEMVVAHDLMRPGMGRGTDQHLPRPGHRLQPIRRVHDVAHRGVVAPGTERSDEHLASVDPDPHLDAVRDPGDVLRDRLLHAQRRPHGPLGVVLVGDRGTEQSEDRVTDDLVDLASERDHIGHEALEAVVDQVLQRLGIHRLGEPGETDQVGEQDRHDTTLVGARQETMPARGAESSPSRRNRAA